MFFVDTTCADPRDASRVYGPTERLEVDHDAPPGTGWRFAASTLDPFAYPDDPRLHQDISCPRIVWIDDQRFLAGIIGPDPLQPMDSLRRDLHRRRCIGARQIAQIIRRRRLSSSKRREEKEKTEKDAHHARMTGKAATGVKS